MFCGMDYVSIRLCKHYVSRGLAMFVSDRLGLVWIDFRAG